KRAEMADVLAIGPGLGLRADVCGLVSGVIHGVEHPVVLDADALSGLGECAEAIRARKLPAILTPHPGEVARMLGIATTEVQANREQLAVSYAKENHVVLLLKGHGTIVTDGDRTYTNTTGNPGMATGGTGDILTGVIAAFLGQKLSPFDAAVLGAWVHG